MSAPENLAWTLVAALRASFAVHEIEPERYLVQSPFQFEDGDGYPIVVERHAGGWRVTDLGGTASHLAVDDVDVTPVRLEMLVDIAEGSGFKFDNLVLSRVQAESPTEFDIADVVQAIAQLSALRFISRERVRRLYREDVARFIEEHVPQEFRDMRWRPPNDSKGLYSTEALLRPSGPDQRPTTLFAVGNAEQAERTAVSVLMHQRWELDVSPLVVYDRRMANRIGSPRIYHLQDAAGDDSVVAAASGDWTSVERVLRARQVPVSAG